jgi:hypothetical protein
MSTSPSCIVLALMIAACSSSAPPAGGAPPEESGGSGAGGTKGGGGSGGARGDVGVPHDAGSGTTPDATAKMPDAGPDTTADAGPDTTADATSADAARSGADSATPMGSDGGPQPSYEGEIPIYDGPDVGPFVKMQCPEDPTAGWTEYQDTFHVERPYTVPLNTRFSIIGGIYSLWVFPNDGPHSPIAHGKGPRTEATYGALHDRANLVTDNSVSKGIAYFTSGMRMWSADMLLETNAEGSIIMQIHTTAAGIGPIYMGFTGGNLTHNLKTAVTGSSVPGGLVNTWFNLKVAFNAATLKSELYVNNCLKATVSGPRGDGHFYFKNGVYGCRHAEGCREHVKNIHLYAK